MGIKDIYHHLKSTTLYKIIKLAVIFLLHTADLTTDWMLFAEVKRAEKGLVFGAPEDAVVWSFLAFSIIGTITCVGELVVHCLNYKADGEHDRRHDIVSAVVIWIQDIPQVSLSFILVLCRQDAISWFQVAKAIVVIIGIIRRLELVCRIISKCCCKGKAHCCSKFKWHYVFIGLLVAGVIIEAALSCVILGLNFIDRDSLGHLEVKSPKTGIKEPVEDQAYFTNVGLFVHHSELFDMEQLDPDKTDSVVNWLHLNLISGLKEGEEQNVNSEFNIQYEKAKNGTMFLTVWIKSRKTQWMLHVSGCYSIDPSTPKISILPSDTCKNGSILSSTSERLMMKFRFEKPDPYPFKRKRYIGEIFGSVKLWKNGKCSSMDYAENVKSEKQSSLPLTLHYFKMNGTSLNLSTVGHFVNENSTSPRFFRNDGKDMESVSSAVKTGWTKCDYTGSVSPVYDENMDVDCHFNP